MSETRSLDQLAAEVSRHMDYGGTEAVAELVARAKQAEAQVCQFGCGPYPEGETPGGAGVGLVPACPVHGWVIPLLDARDERAKAVEADRDGSMFLKNCAEAALRTAEAERDEERERFHRHVETMVETMVETKLLAQIGLLRKILSEADFVFAGNARVVGQAPGGYNLVEYDTDGDKVSVTIEGHYWFNQEELATMERVMSSGPPEQAA